MVEKDTQNDTDENVALISNEDGADRDSIYDDEGRIRHSLVTYLLHQPLLLGLVWLFTYFKG